MRSVWVLNWRLELEEHSNQTENVNPEVFWHKHDAVACAKRILLGYVRDWDSVPEEDEGDELHLLHLALNAKAGMFGVSYLFQLSDSDNIVFELRRKRIREK